MPIVFQHTPDLSVLGQAGFYAGQNDLDDRMKADQMRMQRDQMDQQHLQFMTNQDVEMYKQMAQMANANDQLQYRTQADAVQQYNQQQNQNAQMQFREQADAFQREDQQQFQVGMAQFQAGERQNAQQEEFRLRDLFEKNQLNRHEELRKQKLEQAIAWVEEHPNLSAQTRDDLIGQLRTGISPLEQRQRAAQTAMMEMKQIQLKQEVDQQVEFQRKQISKPVKRFNDDAGGTLNWFQTGPNKWEIGNATGQSTTHPVGSSGGTRSSGTGGGSGGLMGVYEKEYAKLEAAYEKAQEFDSVNAEKQAMARVRERMKDEPAKLGITDPEELKKFQIYKTVDGKETKEFTWWGERAFTEEMDMLRGQHGAKLQAIEQRQAALVKKMEESKPPMTYANLPPKEKVAARLLADQELKRSYPHLTDQDDDWHELKALMVEEYAQNFAKKPPTNTQIPQDQRAPTQTERGESTTLKPIETGKETPEQQKVLELLSVAEGYASGFEEGDLIREGARLYRKYGSVEAMKRLSPGDFQMFLKVDDIATRLAGEKIRNREKIREQTKPRPIWD